MIEIRFSICEDNTINVATTNTVVGKTEVHKNVKDLTTVFQKDLPTQLYNIFDILDMVKTAGTRKFFFPGPSKSTEFKTIRLGKHLLTIMDEGTLIDSFCMELTPNQTVSSLKMFYKEYMQVELDKAIDKHIGV